MFNNSFNLCPDIRNGQGLYQSGNSNYFNGILNSFRFEIVKCSSIDCTSKTEYDNFLSDLIVMPYILQKQMDFN